MVWLWVRVGIEKNETANKAPDPDRVMAPLPVSDISDGGQLRLDVYTVCVFQIPVLGGDGPLTTSVWCVSYALSVYDMIGVFSPSTRFPPDRSSLRCPLSHPPPHLLSLVVWSEVGPSLVTKSHNSLCRHLFHPSSDSNTLDSDNCNDLKLALMHALNLSLLISTNSK